MKNDKDLQSENLVFINSDLNEKSTYGGELFSLKESFKIRLLTEPKLQKRIFITVVSLLIILILGIFEPSAAHARAYKIMGIDYDLIDWCELCASVEPIEFENCDIVHPTFVAKVAKLKEQKGTGRAKLDCTKTKKKFTALVTDKKACRKAFISGFQKLVTDGDIQQFTAKEFRDKYLSAGVIDIHGIDKARKLFGG